MEEKWQTINSAFVPSVVIEAAQSGGGLVALEADARLLPATISPALLYVFCLSGF